jgi:hypothetical protein
MTERQRDREEEIADEERNLEIQGDGETSRDIEKEKRQGDGEMRRKQRDRQI